MKLKEYKELLLKYGTGEKMLYLIFGVLTTLVNIASYWVFTKILKLDYMSASVIAWIIAVIFAYVTNKIYVFNSRNFNAAVIFKEAVSFFAFRFLSLLIDLLTMFILVEKMQINDMYAKVAANVIVIIMNYFSSKLFVFKKKNHASSEVDKKADKHITFSAVMKNSVAVLLLLIFSVCCHFYVIHSGSLFGKSGTDSTLQFMYFVPFIQKQFLSGQPFWSWVYGLGGDVFGGFSYYYTTSPFFYLMLLLRKLGIGTWTLEDTLRWKLVFSILKQFLSMLFLYVLLKYEKRKTYSSLIGAAIYGGCINFIWFSLFNDFMADAYIWLPLTVLGWRIYKRSSNWVPFVISAALTVANSFYFGFISFVFYIIFIIVFMDVEGTKLKDKICSFFGQISKYAIFAVIALGLSAVAFLPSVLAFLKVDRFSNSAIIPMFYDRSYILQLPEKFFYYFSTLGFPMIVLIVFALPWRRLSKVARKKTILAGIFFVLYLIPYTGSFFNGLSYSVDRWFYLLIFSIAYAVPDWLEENDRLKSAGLKFISISFALILYFYYTKASRGLNYTIENVKLTSIINRLILVSGLISILAVILKRYISHRFIKNILSCIIVFAVGISLICNINSYLYIVQPDMSKEKIENYFMHGNEEEQVFNELAPSNSEFFRTITSSPFENSPLSQNYYGTSAYNSMVDGNLHKWLKVNEDVLNHYVAPNIYANFDDRLFLETAFGVKYLVRDKNDPYVPAYGYVLKKETDKYKVYESTNNVGFDLWYTNTVDVQSNNKMNFAEKDALLLQEAVVDKSVPGLSSGAIDDVTTELSLAWGRAVTENMEYKDGTLTAGKNASISIPINNTQKGDKGEILFSMNIKPANGQMINLNVNGKSTLKMEETYPYIYPLNTFTFRLDGNTKILKINISEGKFTIDNAHAWFNSYKHYENWINARNKYNLENLHINGGDIKATIKNDEKGIIALSIPYSKGWSAKVDGKKQDLIKVNGVFTGLVLEPGAHRIELTYITPGLIPGACISITFLIGIIMFHILKKNFSK
ncbi:GtrA family protein [Clostridium sp. 'White wine YQ']|uniref:GtrA family protein n=1 Tax=Clostridium sp. 'White wine YQ' TaxID=3027474 RepID=UPI002366214C|nr:GtrA family protein [Clostridium sp. 'White wine YQ']